MDARFLGFSISLEAEKLSFDAFMQTMSEELHHTVPALENSVRNVYFDCQQSEDFYFGMVVTIKNQKKFCKGKALDGDFTFDVIDLDKAEKILDFNYFIISKETGFGLYQHYHQSCAARQFGKILKDLFNSYRASLVTATIASREAEQQKELTKKQLAEVNKDHRASLNFSILVRPENLEQVLNEYSKIKFFEFEYLTLTPDLQAATPLADHVLKKRERLRFHTPTNVRDLAAGIANFAKGNDLASGKIIVENEIGDEFPMRLFNMPDYFAVYDYDELADYLANVKASEFHQSRIVELLLETFTSDEHSHIFQIKVKDEV